MTTGKRLHRLADVGEIHMGRQIDVNGMRGTLTGLIPIKGRVVVAMVVGGARVWSDALPGETCVEIWKEGP